MEFKDYKEKQKFYKARAKQENIFWISIDPIDYNKKRKGIKKGLTYVKPKESDK